MEEYQIEGDGSQTEEQDAVEEEKNDDIDVDKLLDTNKKLYARAKSAEAEAKRVKELEEEIKKLKETPTPESAPAAPEGMSREEAILFAKGLSLEEVDKAKAISALEGTGLLAAVESDIFKAWKTTVDNRKKDEDAELENSGGSPKAKKKIDFNTPGLTDEQHRELFKKRFNR